MVCKLEISLQLKINKLNFNSVLSKKSGTHDIANGKSITIKNLAEKMIFLSNKELELKFALAKEGEIKHSHADITLAKKELKFSPKYGLDKIKELLE